MLALPKGKAQLPPERAAAPRLGKPHGRRVRPPALACLGSRLFLFSKLPRRSFLCVTRGTRRDGRTPDSHHKLFCDETHGGGTSSTLAKAPGRASADAGSRGCSRTRWMGTPPCFHFSSRPLRPPQLTQRGPGDPGITQLESGDGSAALVLSGSSPQSRKFSGFHYEMSVPS